MATGSPQSLSLRCGFPWGLRSGLSGPVLLRQRSLGELCGVQTLPVDFCLPRLGYAHHPLWHSEWGLPPGCGKLRYRAHVSLPTCARGAGAAPWPQQRGGKLFFPFMQPLARVATGWLVGGQEEEETLQRAEFKKLATLTSMPWDSGCLDLLS